MNFSGTLLLREVGEDLDTGLVDYELQEDLHYEVFPGHIITVPKGFVTNFASTPRWLWSILPPSGKWNRAAVLHDYLYSIAVPTAHCSRWMADAIFRDAMYRLGVSLWRRWVMWAGVRVFGNRGYWKSNGSIALRSRPQG
jgi:hypothetical protein